MDHKMTLTEDNLQLAAAYLNMNDEGQALLDALTKKLAKMPEREINEKRVEKNNDK